MLLQSVVLKSEELSAFRTFGCRTDVQIETEFGIQSVEKKLRRFPVLALAHVVDFAGHWNTLGWNLCGFERVGGRCGAS